MATSASSAAIQIYNVQINQRRQLDLNALKKVLEPVRGLPVVWISINGIKRSGKSFVLNIFLNYLQSLKSTSAATAWSIESAYNSITAGNFIGFDWAGGAERNTIGMWIWSEAFVIRDSSSGQEFAVILADTQGNFDEKTSFVDNVLTFAISSWFSNIFIYNVTNGLSEDKLQILEYFCDVSQSLASDLAAQSSAASNRPLFQHFLLLMRDWACPADYSYGWHSTSTFAATGRGQTSRNFTEDFKNCYNVSTEACATRKSICSKYDQISSFLSPHPGLKLSQRQKRTPAPSWQEIEPEFLSHMQELVQALFQNISQDCLRSGGQIRTGQDMINLATKWTQLLNSNTILADVQNLNQANAEAHLHMEMNKVEKSYAAKLLELASIGLTDQDFQTKAKAASTESLQKFKDTAAKQSGGKYTQKFTDILGMNIQNLLELYSQFNILKRIEHEQQETIKKVETETAALRRQINQQVISIKDNERELETQKNLNAEEKRAREEAIEMYKQNLERLQKEKALRVEEREKHVQALQKIVAQNQVAEPQVIRSSGSSSKGVLGFLGDVLGAVTTVGKIVTAVGKLFKK